jgi:hypothetical protein
MSRKFVTTEGLLQDFIGQRESSILYTALSWNIISCDEKNVISENTVGIQTRNIQPALLGRRTRCKIRPAYYHKIHATYGRKSHPNCELCGYLFSSLLLPTHCEKDYFVKETVV